MADQLYPEMSFHFEVQVDGSTYKFQEVTGLEVSVEVEEIKEGGRLHNSLRYPTRTKYGTISLKRGIVYGDSDLAEWIKKISNAGRLAGAVVTKDLMITLLDEFGSKVMSWNVRGAYPTKYAVANLNSMENSIAYETIEFTYSEFILK